MSIADLPPGRWTPLLIGDLWPSSASVSVLSAGTATRENLSSEFATYFERVLGIKRYHLDPQEGFTAEDARAAFDRGAAGSSHIAHVNDVKSSGYMSVRDKVIQLRSALKWLAEDGNREINEISSSQMPLADKVAEILRVVTRTRDAAFLEAAACVGHISDQIRAILRVQGIDTPPQAFASAHGVSGIARTPSNREELERQILMNFDGSNNPATEKGENVGQEAREPANDPPDLASAGTSYGHSGTSHPPEGKSGVSTSLANNNAPGVSSLGSTKAPSTTIETDVGNLGATQPATASPPLLDVSTPGATAPAGRPPIPEVGDLGATTRASATPAPSAPPTPSLSNLGATAPSAPPTPSLSNLGATTASATDASPSMGSPGAGHGLSTTAANVSAPTATPNIDTPATTTAPSAGNTVGTAHTPSALTPNDLAQRFNAGNQTGAQMSASAEAISSAATSSVQSAPPPFAGQMADVIAPATHPSAAAMSHAEATQIAQAPTTFSQPAVAAPNGAPITSAAPPLSSAGPLSMPTTPPSSGLLAYGSDLRPAATSVPAPPSMPPAAAPASAPVSPASGSNPTGQPAVVRHQPPAAAAQAAAAVGLTERAFAATAIGAVAGASATQSAAKERLQRLLEAVARQQPKLNWAIGDLENGTTLLVTDLASGWIPPSIEIPTGVRLLAPSARSGRLEAMLGPTTITATYRPGQYLPPAKDVEPVAMSIRARDTTYVDDLGWELSQATKWRDGLPRLAHTLAKAASSQTGHLDSEAQLLRDYLNSVARLVMSKYPDDMVPTQVGNWQLLATIDALINHETTLANYHFAWFQAQVLAREGKQ
jgi:hypothetical protein